jgi:transcriptional regulator with XRE-family HTH domain
MQCRLKELRLSRGLSQEGLALLINTSQQTISRVEAGITELAADVAVRAAEYFQVSVDYILGLTEEKENKLTISKTMHIYKQHEEFFAEFEQLNVNQKEAVSKLIHELFLKQEEAEKAENE